MDGKELDLAVHLHGHGLRRGNSSVYHYRIFAPTIARADHNARKISVSRIGCEFMIVAFRSAKGSFCGAKADTPFRSAKDDNINRTMLSNVGQSGLSD